MPIKILSANATSTKVVQTETNLSSSVSGNIPTIKSQIKSLSNDFINIKNAVKILEKCSNSNGYIKLSTEVESNFLVGDTVYVTYTEPTIPAGVFNLENPTIPFVDFYLGYKILSVNNTRNEIVINRNYNDTSGLTLKNQFLSKISCRGGNYYDNVADGVVFYNCNIFDSLFSPLTGLITGSTIAEATVRACGITAISD